MRKVLKRIIAVMSVLALSAAMAIPVFAQSDIYTNTGTQTVYLSSNDGKTTSFVYVSLASGSSAFTIKRTDVKVTKGTTDAEMFRFSKYQSTSKGSDAYRSESGAWNESSYSSNDYSYNIELRVKKAGTAKVTYKIGQKSYTTSVKVLNYQNPVKTITLTGVNGGKNFASLTKNSSSCSKELKLSTATKNAQLNITPASGWKIQNASISDGISGISRSISNYSKGLTSANLKWGSLNPAHNYSVNISLFNTSTNATMYLYYPILGTKAS